MNSDLWYDAARWIVALPALAWWQVRFFGRERLPREGGFVIVSNHQSHLDPPFLGIGCPRRIHYLARRTLFDVPLLGPLIRGLRAIPIERDGMGLAGIKESLRVLKQGRGLLLFPEGTRTPDGRMHAFRPGFATLAVRSGATVIPAAIEGAFDAWPRTSPLPRPRPTGVCYGEPIPPSDVKLLGERGLVAECQSRVESCLAELHRHGFSPPLIPPRDL